MTTIFHVIQKHCWCQTLSDDGLHIKVNQMKNGTKMVWTKPCEFVSGCLLKIHQREGAGGHTNRPYLNASNIGDSFSQSYSITTCTEESYLKFTKHGAPLEHTRHICMAAQKIWGRWRGGDRTLERSYTNVNMAPIISIVEPGHYTTAKLLNLRIWQLIGILKLNIFGVEKTYCFIWVEKYFLVQKSLYMTFTLCFQNHENI